MKRLVCVVSSDNGRLGEFYPDFEKEIKGVEWLETKDEEGDSVTDGSVYHFEPLAKDTVAFQFLTSDISESPLIARIKHWVENRQLNLVALVSFDN